MATVTFPEIGNNGATTLNGAISDSTTTVIVDDVTSLTLDGSTTDAYITVIDRTTWRKNPLDTPEVQEIMKVTAISSNTLTVTRAQDGTTGKAFSDNDIVELRRPAIHDKRITNALTDGNDTLNFPGVTGGFAVGGALSADINLNWNDWIGPDNGMWVGPSDIPTLSTFSYAGSRRVTRVFDLLKDVVKRTYGTTLLPEDYDGRALKADLYWTQSDTNTSTVTFQLGHAANDAGDDLTDFGTQSSTTTAFTPPGVVSELIVSQFSFTPANGSNAAGQILNIALLRNGATDTNTGTARLIGVKFHY